MYLYIVIVVRVLERCARTDEVFWHWIRCVRWDSMFAVVPRIPNKATKPTHATVKRVIPTFARTEMFTAPTAILKVNYCQTQVVSIGTDLRKREDTPRIKIKHTSAKGATITNTNCFIVHWTTESKHVLKRSTDPETSQPQLPHRLQCSDSSTKCLSLLSQHNLKY